VTGRRSLDSPGAGDIRFGAIANHGAASTQVLSSASLLSGESHGLKAEVDMFLATVRAA
jgi:hypothetical protein